MERTLIILKPSAIQRFLVGDVITRFQHKALRIAGIKMMQLDETILREDYAHLVDRPFFPFLLNSMMLNPVIVMCLEGKDAVEVVRGLTGATNSRKAAPRHNTRRFWHERPGKHHTCLRLAGKCRNRNKTLLQAGRDI